MKYKQINKAYEILRNAKDRTIEGVGIQSLLYLSRNLKLLAQERELYEKARQTIVDTYKDPERTESLTDEEIAQGLIYLKKDKLEEAHKAFQDLEEQEVETGFKKIPLGDLVKLKELGVTEIMELEGFIEEND